MNLNHSYNLMCLKTNPAGNTSFNTENKIINFFKTKTFLLNYLLLYCTVLYLYPVQTSYT